MLKLTANSDKFKRTSSAGGPTATAEPVNAPRETDRLYKTRAGKQRAWCGTGNCKRASRVKMIALKMKMARGKRIPGVGCLATEERQLTNANLPVKPGIGRVNNASPHGRSFSKLRLQEERKIAKMMVASGRSSSRAMVSSGATQAKHGRIVRCAAETGLMRHACLN